MKKTIKILLPLVIVAVLFGSTMTQAAYGVSIGQTFTYDVVESNWEITFGTDTSSGTGFNFLDVNRAVGTQFDVDVTAAAADSVDWEMVIGTDTETGSSSAFDAFGVLILTVMPLILIEGTFSWNQTEVDLGISIISFFFAEPVSFSDLFYDLTDEPSTTGLVEPGLTIDNFGGTFDNDTSTAVFEWHLDMSYTNATTSTDLSGTYVWQYAYDKTTGQMKGNYLNIDYSGTKDGEAMTYQMEQKIEEVGYNLPNINGFLGLPGFEWFIAIPIVAILGGITIIKKKRRT